MKRLIRKAFGTTLYHGTALDNLKNVVNSGQILPNESSSGGGSLFGDNVNYDGFVFLATDIETAKRYSKNYYDYVKVILEINISEEALLPDDDDCYECKTWQESAEKIQQVKVSGPITSDYITKIIFFIGSSIQFEVNFNNFYNEIEQEINKLKEDAPINVQSMIKNFIKELNIAG